MSTSRHEMTKFQKRRSPVGLFDLDKAEIGDKTVVMLFTAKWCQPCKVLMSCIEHCGSLKKGFAPKNMVSAR